MHKSKKCIGVDTLTLTQLATSTHYMIDNAQIVAFYTLLCVLQIFVIRVGIKAFEFTWQSWGLIASKSIPIVYNKPFSEQSTTDCVHFTYFNPPKCTFKQKKTAIFLLTPWIF
ncbi:MAG TPA: hypothetical protein DCM62_02250 [Bacteroidales bacterium]|nr:hypothetical protein [Bacteroidales bacterium]